jgi:hypothetical protein
MPTDSAPIATASTDADTPSADPKLRFRCRHIFADGHRCGSPSLRKDPFCYYHHTSRRPTPAAGKFRYIDSHEPFTLPLIEDRTSAMQVASIILGRIASNDLDATRAIPIIACLRAALACLPPEPRLAPAAKSPTPAPDLFDDPILDQDLGPIAPITELPTPEPELEPAPVPLFSNLQP